MPELGFYDYLTFASLLIILVAVMIVMVLILGLPGRIARKRKHPEAEAIYVMGWLGFLGGVPWLQAFLWAFKPTDVVDIRRFPREEGQALAEEFAEPSKSSRSRHRSPQQGESAMQSDPTAAGPPNPAVGDSESDETQPTNDTLDD